MMAQSQNNCQENVEANYEKYKNFGDEVYQEYDNLYRQMWAKLHGSHLEPLAKVLMEHENIALKGQYELVDTIRNKLEQQMQKALQDLWQSNNISEALISLEMCKEKFKSYEGHKWNMDAKTPWERTRPIRMRFKENRLRYLQAQLNFQNKQLEEVVQENINLRQHIQDVRHQRSFLSESIENFRKKIELVKAEIAELQQKMLLNDDYTEPNTDAENGASMQS